ncbi:type I-G CRISPR-associated protein Csb2 [Stratiformator vulcanicus]|uniref:CRISPR-associated protein, family (Cas_GSU0054) n=1 Tax=Stratiformator vulcanicus TaxID=2527980 RepID=A0A517QWU3_9PLAN|nr:type I-U CRISPR-associated protein Csb2 [Stratiformator vulcanicus]QDT36038.1 CRISPR-associated protein, family (Cas_GSU0054) [Stratiformator vulcanicus]
MPDLTIAWEYLTGYAVATDPTNRDQAEWPPHPARVFMALAAAWFETEPGVDADEIARQDYAAEADVLRVIERLGEPELHLPRVDAASERSIVTVYVPVNDKAGPSAATIQATPAMTRSRQPRTFPRRYVGSEPCRLHWAEADAIESHRDALDRLCAKVTRIGHSSSLVRMWVADDDAGPDAGEVWVPEELSSQHFCRAISPGLLDSLPDQTQIPRIERFAELVAEIQDAERDVAAMKGSGDKTLQKAARERQKIAKKAYEEQTGEKYKANAATPARLRPHVGQRTGYARVKARPSELRSSHFDSDLLILAQESGPRLLLATTLKATAALRRAVMDAAGGEVPDWVSGHAADGKPADRQFGHLSFLPLPFVGREHADGHLLGLALAFPEDVTRSERGQILGPLLIDESGRAKAVTLDLHGIGKVTLQKRSWDEPSQTLDPETWTGSGNRRPGSECWASVTPVVLDRFPKADRRNDRIAWEEEVREIIRGGVDRIGLPRPEQIDVDTTSWHRGSPRATSKRRKLRTDRGDAAPQTVATGGGFPPYPSKGTNASRPQVHVFLRFADPVIGPIAIGAGRYRGYGFFKPWRAGS